MCSVVAVDIHEPLALLARRNIAANGLSQRISVACCDVGLVERGRDVRQQGCNFVVMDMFDAGLLGDRIGTLLAMASRNVLQPGATVVPAAATVYCVGIEALTSDVHGFDFSAFNKYRCVDRTRLSHVLAVDLVHVRCSWGSGYESVRMRDVPHRRLTRPKKVFEFFFDGALKSTVQEGVIKLEPVADGKLNAVCFWFDLHLDEEATITTAPPGIDKGGQVADDTAVRCLSRAVTDQHSY